MRIELEAGAVRLGPNQTLKLRDGAGTHRLRGGRLGVDHRGKPAARHRPASRAAATGCATRGLAIVNALGGAAAVSFA